MKIIRDVETRLREGGIDSARAEAEWLVAEACGFGRTELYATQSLMGSQTLQRIDRWVSRRLTGEPLQYVLGSTEFCGHRLAVSPDVLIPRPETETLVDYASRDLDALAHRGATPRVADLGTGSGNIAISLAHAVASCVVVAVELSWDALRIARTNLHQHRLEDRVHLIQADWTDGMASGAYHVVIANPPYVPTRQIGRLPGEVGREPRMSLDGGPDGMALHRRLIDEAPRVLAQEGGAVYMECAESQAEPLRQILRRQPWAHHAEVLHDLAGRPRGVWAIRGAL